ncbi:hypothetical protein [Allorhodopirellula heiligendammensis]|uniref:hypothetical protein n=1 Tax=Allorhodopirellula heiligendammensis TaxID=2714739 RepID=UPI00265EC174|nr:hypothetical protein [Allorhodopirellula heiligendammensis]
MIFRLIATDHDMAISLIVEAIRSIPMAASTPWTGQMLAVERSERQSLIANESLRSATVSQAFAIAPIPAMQGIDSGDPRRFNS